MNLQLLKAAILVADKLQHECDYGTADYSGNDEVSKAMRLIRDEQNRTPQYVEVDLPTPRDWL